MRKFKRTLAGLMLVMLLVSFMSVASAKTYAVTKKAAKAYKTADTKSKVVYSLPKGTKVRFLGAANGWANIMYNGKRCWVKRNLVEKETGSGSSSTTVKPITVVNVRSAPDGLDPTNIIGKVKMKDTLTVIKRSGNWLKISCKGMTGWVYKFLTTY